jgi:hypothetical protein
MQGKSHRVDAKALPLIDPFFQLLQAERNGLDLDGARKKVLESLDGILQSLSPDEEQRKHAVLELQHAIRNGEHERYSTIYAHLLFGYDSNAY